MVTEIISKRHLSFVEFLKYSMLSKANGSSTSPLRIWKEKTEREAAMTAATLIQNHKIYLKNCNTFYVKQAKN